MNLCLVKYNFYLLQPNTDPRFSAPTVGKVLLQSRGFFADDYWFWICVGALFGFSLLFNLLFICALTYLNRKLIFFILGELKFSDMVKLINVKQKFQLWVIQRRSSWMKLTRRIKYQPPQSIPQKVLILFSFSLCFLVISNAHYCCLFGEF